MKIFFVVDALRAKVPHNFDNHNDVCVQQREDNHSDLFVQQHNDTLYFLFMSAREVQWRL